MNKTLFFPILVLSFLFSHLTHFFYVTTYSAGFIVLIRLRCCSFQVLKKVWTPRPEKLYLRTVENIFVNAMQMLARQVITRLSHPTYEKILTPQGSSAHHVCTRGKNLLTYLFSFFDVVVDDDPELVLFIL